ncbi:UNVERIFIED_ORG: hypothetical protein C7430_110201 [Pantoea agglomerans]|uniref:Uncharacterized protein n=1 Tax=Enterobacter agglomerans TaxID=549 RepID=A0ABD6XM17_ENTAG|nr:hypothetical protein [Pantoea agglomerans]WNK70585.1 hypothetical protein RM155_14780 [Pantoea agglomerans]
MPDTYRITVTTKSGETHEGLMNRSQPEIVNGFMGVAQEDGAWVYLAPDDVLKMEYVPEQKDAISKISITQFRLNV